MTSWRFIFPICIAFGSRHSIIFKLFSRPLLLSIRVLSSQQTILSPFTKEYRAQSTTSGILQFFGCLLRGPQAIPSWSLSILAIVVKVIVTGYSLKCGNLPHVPTCCFYFLLSYWQIGDCRYMCLAKLGAIQSMKVESLKAPFASDFRRFQK